MPRTRYTTLSPAHLADECSSIARDVGTAFGPLNGTQFNWQPHAAGWSVGQCLDHLLKADQAMLQAIGRALDPAVTPTLWQRLPLWPRLCGWLLVTSQSPGGRRTYEAPAIARPASSHIALDTIERFVACQHVLIAGLRALGAVDARQVMASPFVAQISYSVLDGYRLIAAHQRRHLEQAMRVTAHPGFPRSQ